MTMSAFSASSISVATQQGVQPSGLAMSLTQARRTPCLARGWRTPDPSPTRGLSDLPSCKPGSWWTIDHEDIDDAETVVDDRSDAGCDGIERGRSLARRCDAFGDSMSEASVDGFDGYSYPTFVPSRTPSPVPYLSVAQKENYGLAMNFMHSRSSQSMSFSTICPESEGSSEVLTPRPMQFVDSRITATSSVDVMIPAPAEMKANWSMTSTADLIDGSDSKSQLPPPPLAPPVIRELLGVAKMGTSVPDDCPSVGSLNHPHGCADFCKYAKKSRGCKDGDACSRCHICTTKKYSNQGYRPRHGYGRYYNKGQQRNYY